MVLDVFFNEAAVPAHPKWRVHVARMIQGGQSALPVLVGLAAFVLILTNGWMSDDSYITFRSVEQLFAGNGPRWNPHERVQVFTHPLWFGGLCLLRLLMTDACLIAVTLSLLCSVATAVILKRIAISSTIWTVAIGILASSKAVIDFSTSGLENPMTHLLCAGFVLTLMNFVHALPGERHRQLVRLSWVLALASTLRLDLVTLLGIPYLWALGTQVWQDGGMRAGLLRRILMAACLPLLWTIFSLVYYGFPVPNTAYAKLGSGIPTAELVPHGVAYLLNSVRLDPITLFTVILSIGICIASRCGAYLAAAFGMVVNLAYVIRVGGDFMSGRFLTAVMVTAVALLVSRRWSRSLTVTVFCALIAYNIIAPCVPWRTDAGYIDKEIDKSGVADEKGYYFQHSSLWQYVASKSEGTPFPKIIWVRDAIDFGKSNYIATVMPAIGIFGYYVRLDQIVIDPMALSDPLLARMPVTGRWRIGHMLRELPLGYTESIANNSNQIVDPELHRLYDQLILITRGPLFTWGRWQAIAALNLGLSFAK